VSEVKEDVVLVRREGSIAILTLNNPRRMNAFSLAMRTQMWERLLELESDESCRAIVLTGAGGNLCAGGDITEMAQRPVLQGRMRMELATRIFRLLVSGPKPLVCAVEGNAAGCGVSFAAASDYCVAAPDAKFKIAFMKVGLIPDVGGLWSIPRRIGHRKAMELAAFAEPFDAQEALRLQLINEVCEPGKALERALITAEKFAANPPIAMALLRNALNTGADSVDAACQTEMTYQSMLQNSDDFGEAAKAFLEKRPPRFTGR
jgi:enoyl-CoA hydratase/carnithine racemase